MKTNTPDADRFEDRLLTAILDDYEILTAPSTDRPSSLPLSSSHRQARRIVPAIVATAAAAAVAVACVAVADGHEPSTPKVATQPGTHVTNPRARVTSAGPVMDLASYRLRLPSSYRLTTTVSCPVSGVGFMSPGPVPAGGESFRGDVPGYASQMVDAANAEGACLSAVLAPAYTPTAASPDPEAGSFEFTTGSGRALRGACRHVDRSGEALRHCKSTSGALCRNPRRRR